MAGTKVWKRFQRIERAAVIVLCVVMLVTLGIGGSAIFESCAVAGDSGTMTVDGEQIEIPLAEYQLFFDRHRNSAGLISELFRPSPDGRNYFSAVIISSDREGSLDDHIAQRWMLRALAERAGIQTSEDSLKAFIKETFVSPETGDFIGAPAYRDLLKRYGTQPLEFEAAITDLLTVREYIESFGDLVYPSNAELTDEYVSDPQQRRIRVEYTWMDLDGFEEQVPADSVTEEEIQTYYDEHKDLDYAVEEKRVVEVAWVHVPTFASAAYDALLETYGDDAALRPTFEQGFDYFRSPIRTDVFTNSALALLRLAEKRAAGEKDETGDDGSGDDEAGDGEAGDGEAGDGEAGDGDGGESEGESEGETETETEGETPAPADDAPEMPGADMPQEDTYRDFWKDYVLKELFFKNLAQRVLDETRETNGDLEKVAGKYGLSYRKLAALPRQGLQGYANFGTLDLAKTVFEMKAEQAGELLPRVLETTLESQDFVHRGFQVARLVRVEPKTSKPLADVRSEIVDILARRKVEKLAREAMKAIADEASKSEKPFADLLAEKELPRVELDPISASTPLPQIPEAGDDATEEQKARRTSIQREFAVRARARSSFGGANPFADPIIDAGSESVILVHRIEKLDPDPIEMTAQDRRQYLARRLFQQIEHVRTVFGYESLRARLAFRAPGEQPGS